MILALSFFVTAILYAAVGFGGGSTYNALLVLVETDYRILPSIALFCNLIVVSGGTYKFARAGHIDIWRIFPWIITSVPAAWLGGYLNISKVLFLGLLGFSLLVAGLQMLWPEKDKQQLNINQWPLLAPSLGIILGLLAGLVGIGGGIFLAPLLHFLRWDNARKIAAACSLFILVNSLAGLAGQAIKLGSADLLTNLLPSSLLFLAVLIGGQIGSTVSASRLNPRVLRLMTAILILYVAGQLIFRWWNMIA